MKITHHPDDATLMSYSAGALPEALSAVVSTHLMLCPTCRRHVRDMELIGGTLIENLDLVGRAEMETDKVVRSIPSLGGAAVGLGSGDGAVADSGLDPVDQAAMRLTGVTLAEVPWKRLGFGVWHYPLALTSSGGGDLRLLKVQRGQALPEHGHGGSELTLVLDGAYEDHLGQFGTGDVADLDDEVEHRPIADPDVGCICVVASERKIRFTGVIGRLLQPLTGM